MRAWKRHAPQSFSWHNIGNGLCPQRQLSIEALLSEHLVRSARRPQRTPGDAIHAALIQLCCDGLLRRRGGRRRAAALQYCTPAVTVAMQKAIFALDGLISRGDGVPTDHSVEDVAVDGSDVAWVSEAAFDAPEIQRRSEQLTAALAQTLRTAAEEEEGADDDTAALVAASLQSAVSSNPAAAVMAHVALADALCDTALGPDPAVAVVKALMARHALRPPRGGGGGSGGGGETDSDPVRFVNVVTPLVVLQLRLRQHFGHAPPLIRVVQELSEAVNQFLAAHVPTMHALPSAEACAMMELVALSLLLPPPPPPPPPPPRSSCGDEDRNADGCISVMRHINLDGVRALAAHRHLDAIVDVVSNHLVLPDYSAVSLHAVRCVGGLHCLHDVADELATPQPVVVSGDVPPAAPAVTLLDRMAAQRGLIRPTATPATGSRPLFRAPALDAENRAGAEALNVFLSTLRAIARVTGEKHHKAGIASLPHTVLAERVSSSGLTSTWRRFRVEAWQQLRTSALWCSHFSSSTGPAMATEKCARVEKALPEAREWLRCLAERRPHTHESDDVCTALLCAAEFYVRAARMTFDGSTADGLLPLRLFGRDLLQALGDTSRDAAGRELAVRAVELLHLRSWAALHVVTCGVLPTGWGLSSLPGDANDVEDANVRMATSMTALVVEAAFVLEPSCVTARLLRSYTSLVAESWKALELLRSSAASEPALVQMLPGHTSATARLLQCALAAERTHWLSAAHRRRDLAEIVLDSRIRGLAASRMQPCERELLQLQWRLLLELLRGVHCTGADAATATQTLKLLPLYSLKHLASLLHDGIVNGIVPRQQASALLVFLLRQPSVRRSAAPVIRLAMADMYIPAQRPRNVAEVRTILERKCALMQALLGVEGDAKRWRLLAMVSTSAIPPAERLIKGGAADMVRRDAVPMLEAACTALARNVEHAVMEVRHLSAKVMSSTLTRQLLNPGTVRELSDAAEAPSSGRADALPVSGALDSSSLDGLRSSLRIALAISRNAAPSEQERLGRSGQEALSTLRREFLTSFNDRAVAAARPDASMPELSSANRQQLVDECSRIISCMVLLHRLIWDRGMLNKGLGEQEEKALVEVHRTALSCASKVATLNLSVSQERRVRSALEKLTMLRPLLITVHSGTQARVFPLSLLPSMNFKRTSPRFVMICVSSATKGAGSVPLDPDVAVAAFTAIPVEDAFMPAVRVGCRALVASIFPGLVDTLERGVPTVALLQELAQTGRAPTEAQRARLRDAFPAATMLHAAAAVRLMTLLLSADVAGANEAPHLLAATALDALRPELFGLTPDGDAGETSRAASTAKLFAKAAASRTVLRETGIGDGGGGGAAERERGEAAALGKTESAAVRRRMVEHQLSRLVQPTLGQLRSATRARLRKAIQTHCCRSIAELAPSLPPGPIAGLLHLLLATSPEWRAQMRRERSGSGSVSGGVGAAAAATDNRLLLARTTPRAVTVTARALVRRATELAADLDVAATVEVPGRAASGVEEEGDEGESLEWGKEAEGEE